tara:strand:- start:81 stop:284 length:204 start_codon:yes stop_codon:yes gene_type:complete
MTFKINANAEFEASSLDEAYEKLVDHFTALMNREVSELEFAGEFEIERVTVDVEDDFSDEDYEDTDE